MFKLTEREEMLVVECIFDIADLLINNRLKTEVAEKMWWYQQHAFARQRPVVWEAYLSAFWQLASFYNNPHAFMDQINIVITEYCNITFNNLKEAHV